MEKLNSVAFVREKSGSDSQIEAVRMPVVAKYIDKTYEIKAVFQPIGGIIELSNDLNGYRTISIPDDGWDKILAFNSINDTVMKVTVQNESAPKYFTRSQLSGVGNKKDPLQIEVTADDPVEVSMQMLSKPGQLNLHGNPYVKKVYLPKDMGLTYDGNRCFQGCTALETIEFESGTGFSSVPASAFQDCNSLTALTIPGSVSSIAGNAFKGIPSLQNLSVTMSYKTYYASRDNIDKDELSDMSISVVFQQDDNIISNRTGRRNDNCELSLPEGVVLSIGEYAFAGFNKLKHVILPESLLSVGRHAFQACHSLEDCYINWNDVPYKKMADTDSIRSSIPESMFKDCENLTAVHLPENVNYIRDEAFARCKKLKQIHIPRTENGIVFWGNQQFAESGISGITFNMKDQIAYVGDGAENQRIGQGMFEGCVDLSCVNLPAQCKGIPAKFCKKCSALTQIDIPDTVRWIDDYAFDVETDGILPGTAGLSSITLPRSCTVIGAGAFRNTQLTSLAHGGELKEIGDKAFMNCTKLKPFSEISTYSIGDRAFYGCANITRLSVDRVDGQDSITIGAEAFKGTGLTSFGVNAKSLDTSIRQITFGDGAFEGLSQLTSLVLIPNSTTQFLQIARLGERTFKGCKGLTNFVFSTKRDETQFQAPTIPDECFAGCTNIATKNAITVCQLSSNAISMPALEHIGEYAFQDVKSVKTMNVNAPCLTCIGQGAFSGCTILEAVQLGSDKTDTTLARIVATSPEQVTDEFTPIFNGCPVKKIMNTSLSGLTCNNIDNLLGCCSSLTQVDYLFMHAGNITGDASFQSLTTPIANMFDGCGFSRIYAPALTTINKNYMFANCDNLTELSIGYKVVNGSFNCTGLFNNYHRSDLSVIVGDNSAEAEVEDNITKWGCQPGSTITFYCRNGTRIDKTTGAWTHSVTF